MGKFTQIVYTCDLCGVQRDTEPYEVCPICHKDYCEKCSAKVNININKVYNDVVYTIRDTHMDFCKNCGMNYQIDIESATSKGMTFKVSGPDN